MRFESLNDNCIFAFLPEAEPLLGAFSLLSGEAVHHVCTELYGEARLAEWKRRYRFLFETYDAVAALGPYSLFDFLLDSLSEGFTAEGFRDYILSLPDDERVFRQAGWSGYGGTTREDIRRALTDDAALDALYARVEEKCPSFLGVSSFVRQNRRYIGELFALAAELDTPALRDVLRAQEKAVDAFRARTAEELKSSDGLSCSQKLMGKTFHNRGPYETFYFLPSLLLPASSLRLFCDNGTPHNRQILICSIREPEKGREDTIAALRALSDETRYQILMLLAKHSPVNGQDVVRALGLAPSTISHHMTELKERSLITEEPVKTAKYYGISKKVIRELLDTVADNFKLDEREEGTGK